MERGGRGNGSAEPRASYARTRTTRSGVVRPLTVVVDILVDDVVVAVSVQVVVQQVVQPVAVQVLSTHAARDEGRTQPTDRASERASARMQRRRGQAAGVRAATVCREQWRWEGCECVCVLPRAQSRECLRETSQGKGGGGTRTETRVSARAQHASSLAAGTEGRRDGRRAIREGEVCIVPSPTQRVGRGKGEQESEGIEGRRTDDW
jgi:hypothetical protein